MLTSQYGHVSLKHNYREGSMTTLLISEFKAKCLAVLDRVHTDGETVLITRRGKPLAKVVPVTGPVAGQRTLGALAGEAPSKGDLVHVGFEGDWEALK